jgi:hypothetical protein
MKKILLLDREFGAGASTIGEKIATRLKWQLFDELLTQKIARLARIPVEVCRRREERVDPWPHKLVNLIWRGTFDRNVPSPDLRILDADCLAALIQQVLRETVESKPCVIVGRSAPYFLRDRTDTFSVFLYASRDLRFRRVFKRVGDRHLAIELVDQMDEDRRKFVKHYFGHEWPNRQLFDVMINTAIGDDNVVEGILQLMTAADQGKTGQEHEQD